MKREQLMQAWESALVQFDFYIVFVSRVQTTLQQLWGDVGLTGYVVVDMQRSDKPLAKLPVGRCLEIKYSTSTCCPTMVDVVRNLLMQQTSRFQHARAGNENANTLDPAQTQVHRWRTAAAQAPPRTGKGCIQITTRTAVFCNQLMIALMVP